MSLFCASKVQAYQYSEQYDYYGYFNEDNVTLYKGKSFVNKYVLYCTYCGENADLDIVSKKWSSSNASVASVNQSGNVYAKKKGTTTITLKLHLYNSEVNEEDYINLSYQVKVKGPVLNVTSVYLYKNEKYKLKVTGNKGTPRWSSSKRKVATVKNGKVKAKKKGTAYIYCKVNGEKLKCKVKVLNPSLSSKNMTITSGFNDRIYIYGNSRKGKWKVKNSSIATVSNKGVVKGKKTGTTTVYCRTDGIDLKCKINVEKNETVFTNKSYYSLQDVPYGSVKYSPSKVYFSGNKMKVTGYIYNKTSYSINKIPYIKEVFYNNYDLIVSKEIFNTKIHVPSFSRRKLTLTLCNSRYYRKHVDLRRYYNSITTYINMY
jgi:hypothetical protein